MRAGRLLLVLALAFGVFLMHTLGHLGDAHPGAGGHRDGMPVSVMAAPVAAVPVMSDPMIDPSSSASGEGSGLAMDMASLCLAVLAGVWVLAALLWAARSRRPYGMAGPLAHIVVVRRSTAPPRRPDLAQLSVLRV